MRSLLGRFFDRFWSRFGLIRKEPRYYQLEEALIDPVLDLAQREDRTTAEMVSRLIGEALSHRRAAEQYLRIWQELSPRGKEVAALTCLNYTNVEIAKKLNISVYTAKAHVQMILRKFGMRRKEELRRALAEWDFTEWDEKSK